MSTRLQWSPVARDTAFQAWYKAGRPALPAFAKSHIDPATQKPIPFYTLRKWFRDEGWEQYADKLDSQARQKTEKEIVGDRVKMLRRQRKLALRLQKKAYDKIGSDGFEFENEFAALRAIEIGTALERSSVGSAEMFDDISTMSDAQVAEALRMLSAAETTNNDLDGFEEQAKIIDVTPRSG